MSESETEQTGDAEGVEAETGLEAEVAKEEVAHQPNEVADPPELVKTHIPEDIRARFEVFPE